MRDKKSPTFSHLEKLAFRLPWLGISCEYLVNMVN